MGAATMGATMLDENCIVWCPIWYRQSMAKNIYMGESGAALVNELVITQHLTSINLLP